jgi:hypothetical protein
LLAAAVSATSARAADAPGRTVDFNREIRPILSNYCFQCHGPDAKKRKGVSKPLRLDTEEGAFADLGGYRAIERGKPEESALIERVTSDDAVDVMPPANTGKKLSAHEVELLTEWVKQGAPYAKHWSYTRVVRPPVPAVRDASWPRNPVDAFILARLEREGLRPSPEADRYALIRRLALDLTGLPPTWDEVERFVHDNSPDAYARLVDRLLDKSAYGEHWARMWLDLARYADSAGYADDPPRTIWAYRDYVIRAFNANKPFDQFTVEQIAGDLLPNPTEDQLVATAFHRNTLTNNEGGTNDEEFRNVAVVDRVNTTMAVWMGTTMACAQCHDHKYDPLTQKEYFQLFAFFNNTSDADLRDESPLLSLYLPDQLRQKAAWEAEAARLETTLRTPTPALRPGQERWEKGLADEPAWAPLKPGAMKGRSGTAKFSALDDRSVRVESSAATDVYTVELPDPPRRLAALRLEALPDDGLPGKGPGHALGNFVVSRVSATVNPPGGTRPAGRYVRVELPGPQKILSLAEVQVFSGSENVAPRGVAKQSSVAFDGPAKLAIDGNTDGRYTEARSTTHTETTDSPWWEVDLRESRPVDRIAVWNRTDNNLHTRLSDFTVTLLDEAHNPVWTQAVKPPPNPSASFAVSPARPVPFSAALADYAQPLFEAASVLNAKDLTKAGWAVGGRTGQAHALTLVAASPVDVPPGATLTVTIEHLSKHPQHTLGRFRLAAADDPRVAEFARVPAEIRAALKTPAAERPVDRQAQVDRYYAAEVAPELKPARERLAALKKQLAALKPGTTVPVMREQPANARRKTNVQMRGNFMDLGPEVAEGVPAAFAPLPEGTPRDRLALARWLVSPDNPLTARVIVNRYWEQVFGAGLVPTSEEFGAQGELPTHPELLDWLADELVRGGWDLKAFLKLLVTSATYRQGSKVTPEQLQRDPDNRLLARGPRFRLPAETVRDQALLVSGLLSPKLFGPPVKPPQPALGLSAAFGGGIDWQTSSGDDRYRRAMYTTWRRSNPYPSMATFDAPNREVCTVRRSRTNTPLQALVTLNDPVYVEAAQALARRAADGGKTPADKARHAFRLCLAREPGPEELARLVRLFESSRAAYAADPAKAQKMAADPLGPVPQGADVAELAAWTVVGNVLLNLDEMFMKR